VNIDHVDQSDYLYILRTSGDVSTWPEHQQRLVEHVKAGRITSEVGDVLKGLPQYADNSVDAIYLGQCVEHFNRGYQLPGILKECLRVLKRGAPIRITTPDLQLLLDVSLAGELARFAPEQPEFFQNALPEDQLSYLMFGAMGKKCTSEHYEGHFHLFTKRSLAVALAEAGFTDIVDRPVSKRDMFCDIVDCGMSHSLGMEACKP
jgi:ubiquinone/menaquinone biosynthesis C-methylase UbiE